MNQFFIYETVNLYISSLLFYRFLIIYYFLIMSFMATLALSSEDRLSRDSLSLLY